MEQKFDPKLRQAMDEIRSVLKKHDIGAHVLLASPTHSEFGMLFDIPSWSVFSFEGSNKIRIKAKAKTDSDDAKKLDASVHMLYSFGDQLANGFLMVEKIKELLQNHIEVDHKSMIGQEPDSVPEISQ